MQPVLSLVVALAAAPALAQAPSVPPSEHPVLREIVGAVSADKLKAIDTQLVGFGTRHTLSETASDTHGLGAARRWVKSQFEEISRDCGGCLETITPSQVFTGARMPKAGAEVMDVVAIQKG
ncbi:MAG: peptidase M28, partial [Gammaproteobacteria bacterium]